MANSYYRIHEMRIIDHGQDGMDPMEAPVDVYILIGNANDFMPIAGWRKASVPVGERSLEFVSDALRTQSFLNWEEATPDNETAAQAAEIKALQESNLRLTEALAEAIAMPPSVSRLRRNRFPTPEQKDE